MNPTAMANPAANPDPSTTLSVACRCDLCMQPILDGQVHSRPTGLVLCRACHRHLSAMPPFFENSVERFLIGNVL
jgi:hypothetical protein